MPINEFLNDLRDIKTQKSKDGRNKPHKIILLLSVIDLIESGDIVDNRIFFSQPLIDQFTRYFNIISKGDDWCQPGPPFFHLRTSNFWKLKVKEGREIEYSKLSTSGGGVKRIVENIDYAYLTDDYYNLLLRKENRTLIRNFLLEHYFSISEQEKLKKFITAYDESIAYGNQLLSSEQKRFVASHEELVRDIAFRRIILSIYDFQCAVCGFRIVYPLVSSPIDAAHLIPWSKSRNDHPTNGMALCKLHHWALDTHIISPTNDYKWKVSRVLDSRRNSENQITMYDGLDILLPSNHFYFPSEQAIEWCLQYLI